MYKESVWDKMKKQRVIEFDLMKGVGIILMMLAHLVFTDGMPKHFIHSFHMPLFLIIAGVFAKDIEDIPSFKDYTRKNAKRLLLPYVVTMLMLCAWGIIQSIIKHDISFFLRHLFSMLTASGDGWQSQWGLIFAGPIWFLVALFWVRELFYGIQMACRRISKYKDALILSICILLSILSVLIHPYLPALPFCILQSFAALGFYAVGWYIHHHPMPKWVYLMCVLVWPFAVMYGGIGIDSLTIKYFPLSFIGACGGTYVIYLLCKAWSNVINKLCSKHQSSNIVTLLTWCGIHSLLILCVHDLEVYSDIYYSIMCRLPIHFDRIWGIGVAILFTYVLMKLPIFKDLYK